MGNLPSIQQSQRGYRQSVASSSGDSMQSGQSEWVKTRQAKAAQKQTVEDAVGKSGNPKSTQPPATSSTKNALTPPEAEKPNEAPTTTPESIIARAAADAVVLCRKDLGPCSRAAAEGARSCYAATIFQHTKYPLGLGLAVLAPDHPDALDCADYAVSRFLYGKDDLCEQLAARVAETDQPVVAVAIDGDREISVAADSNFIGAMYAADRALSNPE